MSTQATETADVQTNVERINFKKPEPRRIKKISPELRRRKFISNPNHSLAKRFFERLKNDSQFFRSVVQLSFVLLCLWIGIEFYLFMQWGTSNGVSEYVQRPPGVEGFLPISALMGALHWLFSGTLNTIHPAGTIILLAIILVSIVFKKAFCSWLCPIGTLSESLWMAGKKIFKRNFTVWRWLDYPLRSIKYLLLFFFVYSIGSMSVDELSLFINSPYNKVADIKMYQFFADISQFALWTILGLMLLSVFIKNFWCRYLCPYGALLGISGLFSPLRITRMKETCVDCELCTKVCPANIKVHKVGQARPNKAIGQVWSDECTSCLLCVEECPVKDTLVIKAKKTSSPIPNWVIGMLIAGTFMAVTGLGILTHHWNNSLTTEEYLYRFQNIHSPIYNHNRGEVPQYSPAD